MMAPEKAAAQTESEWALPIFFDSDPSDDDFDVKLQEMLHRAATFFAESLRGEPTPPEKYSIAENGCLLVNPSSFSQRKGVLLPELATTPAVSGAACAAAVNAAVVDLPSMGFVWIGSRGEGLDHAETAQPPLAEQYTLRNEFFEINFDPATGAMRAVLDYKSRHPRLAQADRAAAAARRKRTRERQTLFDHGGRRISNHRLQCRARRNALPRAAHGPCRAARGGLRAGDSHLARQPGDRNRDYARSRPPARRSAVEFVLRLPLRLARRIVQPLPQRESGESTHRDGATRIAAFRRYPLGQATHDDLEWRAAVPSADRSAETRYAADCARRDGAEIPHRRGDRHSQSDHGGPVVHQSADQALRTAESRRRLQAGCSISIIAMSSPQAGSPFSRRRKGRRERANHREMVSAFVFWKPKAGPRN